MTPQRARLTLIAVMTIFLAAAGNALFLQDQSRSLRMNGLPSTDLAVTQLAQDKAARAETAPKKEPPRSPQKTASNEPQDMRLYIALQRELGQRGYAGELRIPGDGFRLAVLAGEFDNGLPLTGEPTEELLKQILFNPSRAPRGTFADRAEANPRFVMEVQRVLLGLGFFRGTLTGRIDELTASGIKAFEKHRHIPLTGRLTEATLLELVVYSGQPLKLSSE